MSDIFKGWDSGIGTKFVPLSTPLTSTLFDGDAFSTVSTKTALDLQTNFGLPDNARAIVLKIITKDSGSQAGSANLNLSFWFAAGDAHQMYSHKLLNVANDTGVTNIVTLPLNDDNDLYYTVYASGTDTMDITLEILGYWI